VEAAGMEMRDQDIRLVIGAEGKPTAVLVDIDTWERIINALEDAEDVAMAKETLASLDAAGGDFEKAGFISWESARKELEQMDDSEE
jgi:hypothetical protein